MTTRANMTMKTLMVVKVEVKAENKALISVVRSIEEVKEEEITREEGKEANSAEAILKNQSLSIAKLAKERMAKTFSSMDQKILKAPLATSKLWIT